MPSDATSENKTFQALREAPRPAHERSVSHWFRQSHRWLSIVFTVTVIANFVALSITRGGMPPPWVTYAPLLPLFLLIFSGLYLFALPYVTKWRGRATAATD